GELHHTADVDVLDGDDGGRRLGDRRATRWTRQGQRERLVPVHQVVLEDGDGERLRGLAGPKRQDAAARDVVGGGAAAAGRAVGGDVADRDVAGQAGAGPAHDD